MLFLQYADIFGYGRILCRPHRLYNEAPDVPSSPSRSAYTKWFSTKMAFAFPDSQRRSERSPLPSSIPDYVDHPSLASSIPDYILPGSERSPLPSNFRDFVLRRYERSPLISSIPDYIYNSEYPPLSSFIQEDYILPHSEHPPPLSSSSIQDYVHPRYAPTNSYYHQLEPISGSIPVSPSLRSNIPDHILHRSILSPSYSPLEPIPEDRSIFPVPSTSTHLSHATRRISIAASVQRQIYNHGRLVDFCFICKSTKRYFYYKKLKLIVLKNNLVYD